MARVQTSQPIDLAQDLDWIREQAHLASISSTMPFGGAAAAVQAKKALEGQTLSQRMNLETTQRITKQVIETAAAQQLDRKLGAQATEKALERTLDKLGSTAAQFSAFTPEPVNLGDVKTLANVKEANKKLLNDFKHMKSEADKTENLLQDIPPTPRKDLDGRVLQVTKLWITSVENNIHSYLDDIEARQEKIKKLQDLSKAINAAAETLKAKGVVDWSQDPEMKKLLDEVRAIDPTLFPEGKYTFTQTETVALTDSIRSSIDAHEKATAMDKLYLQQNISMREQIYHMLTNFMKKVHEMRLAIISHYK